ncbi:hypothetical protein GCM10009665_26800 [Kitasatospora nipponensis]|uniref:eCIS core domain-containing protein n=1 Tax=Kitasatospora nipponensis TaxID=258049 RepID=A0ABP4GRK4_9ACTN
MALERGARPDPAPAGVSALTPQGLVALQRSIGNAAVTRMLQARSSPGAGVLGGRPQAGDDVQRSAVHGVLGTAGHPLASGLRQEMEARLGADFSDVRVHADSGARRSAEQIGARAYTSGSHVVLGPEGGDKHTLAHELTHVLQQRHAAVAGTDHGDGLRLSDPTDRFEVAAEANARRVMSGATPARDVGPRHDEGGTSGSARPVAQLRRVDAVTGMIVSQNDHYAIRQNDGSLWALQGQAVHPALRLTHVSQDLFNNGAQYDQYQLNRVIVNDCLHTAEEIMNNAVGELRTQAGLHSTIAQNGAGPADFGAGYAPNIALAQNYPGPRNARATPAVGEAYLSIATTPPADFALSPYHAAAVVAVDGNDHVTLEAWAGPGTSAGAAASMYTVGGARSFHRHWAARYFPRGSGQLTVVLSPGNAGNLIALARPRPRNPNV